MYIAYDMYVCVFIIYDLFQHFIVSINVWFGKVRLQGVEMKQVEMWTACESSL